MKHGIDLVLGDKKQWDVGNGHQNGLWLIFTIVFNLHNNIIYSQGRHFYLHVRDEEPKIQRG